ncbi:hypothetical protein CcCBS67573_g10537 [Chytriomyces confervae]|uniref:Fe2OG dioxygenase domain-containing protein n=1 Tax=Chytriomyces confervae TaxID=246404 RepID=A0A507CSI9_9FUNG|nr:hypothetical protein CcCBS67573_g10537 [Chytriomyces confervae]
MSKKIAKLLASIQRKEGVPIESLLYLDPSDDADHACAVCLANVGNEPNPFDVSSILSVLAGLRGFQTLKVARGKSYSFAVFASPLDVQAAFTHLDNAFFAATSDTSVDASDILFPHHLVSAAVKSQHPTGRIIHAFKAKRIPFSDSDTLTNPSDILAAIPGLHIVHDFISEEEEERLLEGMEQHPWISLSERQVQHHGFVFDYDSNHIDFSKDPGQLPAWCQFLVQRMDDTLRQLMLQYPHDFDYRGFNQLTLNRYPPGSGISPHVDTHTRFDSPITSVSLLSPVQMEFRTLYYSDSTSPVTSTTPQLQPTHKTLHVQLPPRSICFMAGASRFGWEHGIRARKADVMNCTRVERALRVSLTFRGVRIREEEVKCDCVWDGLCDAKIAGGAKPDRLKEVDVGVNRHGVVGGKG